MTNTEQLKKALQDPDVIKAIQDSLAKETPPQGKPEIDDSYRTVDDGGICYEFAWQDDDFDNTRYDRGLVFKTREAAEFHDFKRVLMTKLQRIADKGDHINSMFNRGYEIFMGDEGTLYSIHVGARSVGSVSFPTKELAQEAIDLHGDDIIKMMKGIE